MNSRVSSEIPGAKRVVIVDDNRTIRALIRAALSEDPRLVVVGEAGDPFEARDVIKSVNPDVLTLDVEMPRMNGLVFLENLMRLRPMPVVMVSNRTKESSAAAISALSKGAIDCIDLGRFQADPQQRIRLAETILMAADAAVGRRTEVAKPAPRHTQPRATTLDWSGRVVLIGSSTGGVETLETVFEAYPEDCPPTLVAQHMPANFIQSFAERLNARIRPNVKVVDEQEPLRQGVIYFGPGATSHIGLSPTDVTSVQRVPATGNELYVPEVDILMRSGLPHAKQTLGVVLTGMGRDGADGLVALRQAGAKTIVQDADTAVVDGMPKAAREAGAAENVLPVHQIGRAILKACSKSNGGRS